MSQGHLDRARLLALFDGELPDRDLRSAKSHLFGCADCEGEVAEALSSFSAPRVPHPPRAAREGTLGHLRIQLDDERRLAAELLPDLRADSAQPALLERLLELATPTWGLFERLIDQARGLVTSNPLQARDYLQAALRVAARLDPDAYGAPRLETAKVRGWSQLGNIQRVLGDFEAAEKCFRRAEFHYWQSDLDPLDEATLLESKAGLRRHQSRFEEAGELIDSAIAIFREVNETHRQGRAGVVKGVVQLYAGRPDLAADEFQRSLGLLDPTQEPHLPAYCLLNQILCLTEADRPAEAAALLSEVQSRAEGVAFGSADRLRVRWIEARVDLGLGRLEEAEASLRQIQPLFVQGELVHDAALATLDLAALLVRAQRTREIPELVEEMIPVFRSLGIQREALAALVLLQKAAEAERLTLALVRETAISVRSASAGRAPQAKP